MNSRGIARVGLLLSSLMVAGSLTLAPDIARSAAMNATAAGRGAVIVTRGGSAVAGDRGNYVQSVGCDKPKKPGCHKPGRRSTRR